MALVVRETRTMAETLSSLLMAGEFESPQLKFVICETRTMAREKKLEEFEPLLLNLCSRFIILLFPALIAHFLKIS